ncbi:MAG TPA: sulfotransferase [Dermatophilaceae bacterium]|nr:sulfotransferase [Dermatophilaceae bacterium]
MPDFLIIGAYKSGTTSMVQYLGQHPSIFMPWLQEPNYFAYPPSEDSAKRRPEVDRNTIYRRHRTPGRSQYEALFADAPPGAVIGECSPEYMRSPLACSRIAAELPNAKLLAILRNPVDRAFSDFQAFVRDSVEQGTFAEAIHRHQRSDPGYHYVTTGFYGQQLKPYFDAFPSGSIKVVLTEDLRAEGQGVLSDVCDWLGVDHRGWTPDMTEQRNVSGRPGNAAVALAYRLRRTMRPWVKPLVTKGMQRRADALLAAGLRRETMEPEVRRELLEVYRDDISLLQSLIGRDLSVWLTDSRA